MLSRVSAFHIFMTMLKVQHSSYNKRHYTDFAKYTYTTSFSSQCTLHIYQLKLQFYDLHMENTTLNSQLRRILQMCHQMDLLSLHISENILSMLEYFGPNFDLRVKHLLPSNLLQFHIESG